MLLHQAIFQGVAPLDVTVIPMPGGTALFSEGAYVGFASDVGVAEVLSSIDGDFVISSPGMLGGEMYFSPTDPDVSGYSLDAVFGSGTDHFSMAGEWLGRVKHNIAGGVNLYTDSGMPLTSSHEGLGGVEVFDSSLPGFPDLDAFGSLSAPELPDFGAADLADQSDLFDLDALDAFADATDLADFATDASDLFDLLDLL